MQPSRDSLFNAAKTQTKLLCRHTGVSNVVVCDALHPLMQLGLNTMKNVFPLQLAVSADFKGHFNSRNLFQIVDSPTRINLQCS